MPTPSTRLRETLVVRLRTAGCVFAEDEAAVLLASATASRELEAMVALRVAGHPLEHVVGWADFCGVRVRVGPGVFIPRRRTEHLARTAAARTRAGAVVLDLCCGTGAIGLAVRSLVGDVELHSSDVEPAAVECARHNLKELGHVYQGDLYDPLPQHLRGRVDTLTANVPYVPTAAIATLPAEAREHEPSSALNGGIDGLDLVRRVAAEAPDWLRPQGHLLVEITEHQASAATRAFRAAGLATRTVYSPSRDATVLVGTRTPR
jgi:release factor glutamine methyltransferase